MNKVFNTAYDYINPKQAMQKDLKNLEIRMNQKMDTLAFAFKIYVDQLHQAHNQKPQSLSFAQSARAFSQIATSAVLQTINSVTRLTSRILIPTLALSSLTLGYDAASMNFPTQCKSEVIDTLLKKQSFFNNTVHYTAPIAVNVLSNIFRCINQISRNTYGLSEKAHEAFYKENAQKLSENSGYLFIGAVALTFIASEIFQALSKATQSPAKDPSGTQSNKVINKA